MEKIKIFLVLMAVVFSAVGCKKNKGTAPTIKTPLPALLVAPANAQPCFLGISVSDKESAVDFTWAGGENADSYDLHYKNLLSGDSVSLSTGSLSANVTLLKNTPYSWYVVSHNKTSAVTSRSQVWRFYNSGPGVSVFPPYPAQLISPVNGQQFPRPTNGVQSLLWLPAAGSSPIKEMTLYTGNTANSLYKQATINLNEYILPVTHDSWVYWKIVTTDILGNTSASEVYSFYLQ